MLPRSSEWSGHRSCPARRRRRSRTARSDRHSSAAAQENVLTSGEQVFAPWPISGGAIRGPDCGKALANAIKGLNYLRISRASMRRARCFAQRAASPRTGRPSPSSHGGVDRSTFRFLHHPQIYSVVSIATCWRRDSATRGLEFDGALAFAWTSMARFLLHSRSLPAGAVVAVFDPLGTIVGKQQPRIGRKDLHQATSKRKRRPALRPMRIARIGATCWSRCETNATKVGCDARQRSFRQHYLHVTTTSCSPC